MQQKHCPKVKENFAQRSHPKAKQEAREVLRTLKPASPKGTRGTRESQTLVCAGSQVRGKKNKNVGMVWNGESNRRPLPQHVKLRCQGPHPQAKEKKSCRVPSPRAGSRTAHGPQAWVLGVKKKITAPRICNHEPVLTSFCSQDSR